MRVCIRVFGIVQGVGFRPTVKRHADACDIAGSVSNNVIFIFFDVSDPVIFFLKKNILFFLLLFIHHKPGCNIDICKNKFFPLEFGGIYEEDFLKKYFAEKGFSKVVCYGMGDGLDAVREAAAAEKNIVVSPAGIAAAKYLQQKFGTPYELFCPPEIIPEWKEKKEQVAGLLNVEELSEKKILIVHQQVLANTLREEFIFANINVAS